ncbi:MAG: hypothetical protein AMXMBFR36_14730 [Acidobacteriota bacterium]
MHPWPASLLGALLPEPERGAIVRRFGGDPPRASFLIGAVEFVAGANFLYESGIAHFRAASEAMAVEFLRQAERATPSSEEAMALTWGGAVVWLGWLLRPTTWLLVSIPLVGLVRSSAYLTAREAVAEPAVWAALRLRAALARLAGASRQRVEFGTSGAPDVVEPTAEGGFVVLSARPKPAWDDVATIEIDERFFRVAHHDQVERDGRRRHRYHLTEAPEHEVIRRLLRYPPAADPDRPGV